MSYDSPISFYRRRGEGLPCSSRSVVAMLIGSICCEIGGKNAFAAAVLAANQGFALFLFRSEKAVGHGGLANPSYFPKTRVSPRCASKEVKGVLGPTCGFLAAPVSRLVSRLVCSWFSRFFLYVFYRRCRRGDSSSWGVSGLPWPFVEADTPTGGRGRNTFPLGPLQGPLGLFCSPFFRPPLSRFTRKSSFFVCHILIVCWYDLTLSQFPFLRQVI